MLGFLIKKNKETGIKNIKLFMEKLKNEVLGYYHYTEFRADMMSIKKR